MKRLVLLLAIALCCTFASAQKRKPVQGKAMIGSIVAEDGEINIRNMQTNEKTKTTAGGFFTIQARVNDTLLFTSVEIVSRKMVLTRFDLDEDLVVVRLDPTGTQLSEVNVDGSKITSESLGLVPANQKRYTPAERKLENATTMSPQRDADKAYTAVGTDGALNALSGRTAQLKKEAQIEKKESWKARLSERYERRYFTDSLKIPSDHVDGFLFYAVDDKGFVKTLETAENEEQVKIQLANLATRYKKTLKSEGRK